MSVVAPLPPDEPARLETLRGLRMLDTPPEAPWDSLVRCAAFTTGCSMAVVSLVDEDRQWFMARVGIDAHETSRGEAFCAHTILGEHLLEVHDARNDARFSSNPLVTADNGVRFYAGIPLSIDGHAVGTLCVIDTRPRTLNDEQRAGLADLACVAGQLLLSHRTQNELERHRQHLEDIVEQRTQALELACRAAEAASQAKSAFLATMSHEIRTPMNGVLGLMELLQKTGLDANQMDLAVNVRESAEALLSLIEDVLDFSKIEAGRMSLSTEPVELRRLVASVLQGLQSTAGARGVRLGFECTDDLVPWIESDGGRLRQILNNLVGNAVKFSCASPGGGQVLVLISTVPAELGTLLRLQVIDNGIGMTPEVMTRIFKPFVQGEESITRQYGGTGLGLSICQRLAQLLDGWIGVDSEPGKGSTFSVHLPFKPCSAPPFAANGGRNDLGDESVPGVLPRPARMLVAEDNPINQKLIRRQLAMLGVDMDLAVDGEDALQQWREGRLHGRHAMLLTDLHMPRMDGYSLAAHIRAEEGGTSRMPIVALSAAAVPCNRDRYLHAGLDDYLAKPLQLARLGVVLQTWLGLPSAQPAASPHADAHAARLAPVIDDAVLPDLFDGDMQMVFEFQQRFVELLERELKGLDTAIEHAEWRHLGDMAHRLKSSCRTVGALRMACTCEAIESGASSQHVERLRTLVQRLRAEATDVKLFLQARVPADGNT